MARPKVEIDWKWVERMFMAQVSAVDIADCLGISVDTFYKRCQKDNKISFSEFIRAKKAKGVTHAKSKFYQELWVKDSKDGIDPKSQMTGRIFWLKNYGGMADRIEQKIDQTIHTDVLEIPDNNTSPGKQHTIPTPWEDEPPADPA